jgi:hypothetical protein
VATSLAVRWPFIGGRFGGQFGGIWWPFSGRLSSGTRPLLTFCRLPPQGVSGCLSVIHGFPITLESFPRVESLFMRYFANSVGLGGFPLYNRSGFGDITGMTFTKSLSPGTKIMTGYTYYRGFEFTDEILEILETVGDEIRNHCCHTEEESDRFREILWAVFVDDVELYCARAQSLLMPNGQKFDTGSVSRMYFDWLDHHNRGVSFAKALRFPAGWPVGPDYDHDSLSVQWLKIDRDIYGNMQLDDSETVETSGDELRRNVERLGS